MENGTAGASSVLSDNPIYGGAMAFKLDEQYWETKANTFPNTIWMRFQRAYRLKKIGVRFFDHTYAPNQMIVVGSDDCANWNPLLYVENTGIPSSVESAYKKWTIPVANSFSCLGLMFQRSAGTDNGWVILESIHMYI